MNDRVCAAVLVTVIVVGCGQKEEVSIPPAPVVASPAFTPKGAPPANSDPPILTWEEVPSLPKKIAVFDHVFWEPDDTLSLRDLIRDGAVVQGKSVLEIGTGSGLVALCCLQAGASDVVVTDINPWAIRNAVYNAELLGFSEHIHMRQVAQNRSGAWAVIGEDERFDVIVSNPPWEQGHPDMVADFALYDPNFALLESIVDGMADHLTDDGRVFLAYGCVTAIRHLRAVAEDRGYEITVHDGRELSELPEVFLPGMLIELHPQRTP